MHYREGRSKVATIVVYAIEEAIVEVAGLL